MSRDLQGRVVAITGAGRGIGLATARALSAAGARVAIGDVDGAVLGSAAESIGGEVFTAEMDVTDEQSFAAFLEAAAERLGPVDVLVNNAGIMPIGPFVEEPAATARRVLEINVLGCMIGMKAALPAMLARGSGHVVNVASVAGKSPVPGGASYCASKAAIVSLTETARVEHHGRGVDFTCVMPSFTATELISGTKGVRFVKNVQPDDVARAIVKSIHRPRPDVYVPGSVGTILRVQALTGRKLRDAGNRLLGADRAFLDVDRAARAGYEERILRERSGVEQAPDEVGRRVE